jgi:hypothetical protein
MTLLAGTTGSILSLPISAQDHMLFVAHGKSSFCL